jgi:glutathione peroxidase
MNSVIVGSGVSGLADHTAPVAAKLHDATTSHPNTDPLSDSRFVNVRGFYLSGCEARFRENAFRTNKSDMKRTSDMNVFDLSAKTNSGVQPLGDYTGKVLLIVNTASKCMFTPQYAELEEIHQRYRDQGLVVLGFPCNQFGEQDPGSNTEIQDFCQVNYGVNFPVLAKIEVNGPEAEPLFEWLKSQAPAASGSLPIEWNFTKFLIGRDGESVQRFAPNVAPKDLGPEIEVELSK